MLFKPFSSKEQISEFVFQASAIFHNSIDEDTN